MYLNEVYVTNASLNINRPFTYYSDEYIEKYKRVKILFRNAFNVALVTECTRTSKTLEEIEEELGYKLSKINEVIDDLPILNDELFNLAVWMSKTTVSPLISCINTMLPQTLRASRKLKDPKKIEYVRKLDVLPKTPRQKEVYEQIQDGMRARDARALSTGIFNALADQGCIEVYRKEARYENIKISSKSFKDLTPDQLNAYNGILSGDKQVSLLYGVTGSGKTEVYLHLARYYLSLNKEVLILVPEISLTPQMIQRVKERFEDVIFYHSELNDQEKYEQYIRVREGEVKIVVGTRSAVFLPFKNLGLIIIDEEHDQSYKQDSTPCYQAKNIAIKRALSFKGKVLLASATPSLESYTRALRGDYLFLRLDKRINNTFPEIEIVDLNQEIRGRGSYIISRELRNELSKCLESRKQAIILLNRRGYSPIIKCGDCGKTLMCRDCDVPLNYHANEGLLKCHHCGRVYHMPSVCPECQGHNFIRYGFGTERAEEMLKECFPAARIERMDRDTTTHKGSHSEILKRFEERKIDILLGTQMISKGLDYPDVILVGILNADAGLMHQDYNASKATFDLLMQASGRSGRAADSGKVLIQAFNKDHYVLKSVLKQDYGYFYNIEMNYRKKAGYPPYSHIIAVYVSDSNEERLEKSLKLINELLKDSSFRVFKPIELYKLKKQKRYRILAMDPDIRGMLDKINEMLKTYTAKSNLSGIKIDVDPYYLE